MKIKKETVLDVVYWASLTYLIYCMIDRECLRHQKMGYDRGTEVGFKAGKVVGYASCVKDMAERSSENSSNDEESE